MLLYPDDEGEARVVLIERTTGDGHHSGEVSFPGGKSEPDDADPAATALREAERGGGPRPRRRRRSRRGPAGSDVDPGERLRRDARRGARRTRADAWPPSPFEVARIIEPPVARFLPDAPVTMVERTIRDWPLRYGSYELDGLSVWGATAGS